MYVRPVIGLNAIGCQLWAPMNVGKTTVGFSRYTAAGFTMGRPVESMPVAQFTNTNGSAEINSPVSRSST
jgi:hypothetical protein